MRASINNASFRVRLQLLLLAESHDGQQPVDCLRHKLAHGVLERCHCHRDRQRGKRRGKDQDVIAANKHAQAAVTALLSADADARILESARADQLDQEGVSGGRGVPGCCLRRRGCHRVWLGLGGCSTDGRLRLAACAVGRRDRARRRRRGCVRRRGVRRWVSRLFRPLGCGRSGQHMVFRVHRGAALHWACDWLAAHYGCFLIVRGCRGYLWKSTGCSHGLRRWRGKADKRHRREPSTLADRCHSTRAVLAHGDATQMVQGGCTWAGDRSSLLGRGSGDCVGVRRRGQGQHIHAGRGQGKHVDGGHDACTRRRRWRGGPAGAWPWPVRVAENACRPLQRGRSQDCDGWQRCCSRGGHNHDRRGDAGLPGAHKCIHSKGGLGRDNDAEPASPGPRRGHLGVRERELGLCEGVPVGS
eukprot:m.30756 g.30756  ORF g.30756 m.30756 type:complete len:416 (-) comp4812_c0_seq1:398-1645(-)